MLDLHSLAQEMVYGYFSSKCIVDYLKQVNTFFCNLGMTTVLDFGVSLDKNVEALYR